MKEYPSIEGVKNAPFGEYIIAFNKLDGSSLRSQYSKKRGWYKWGTRKRMFDHTDPEYGQAIAIFERDYAEPLAKAVEEFKGNEGAIAFLEFFGPNSFAGKHDFDDTMELCLFDVNINKKGIVGPRQFIKSFGHMKIPEVVYEGILTEEFVKDVRDSKFNINEGVVCKWQGENFKHTLGMCKIKTWAYLAKLKALYGQEWVSFWE